MESPTDELLDRAFQLAYFIHGDAAITTRITREAMSRLEAITLAQDKRRYYSATARTKVSLGAAIPGEGEIVRTYREE